MWKIEAVPALREALYQPNPYTALSDSWVLSHQMIDYFQTGRGREALGSAAGIAATAFERIRQELEAVAASATSSKDVRDTNRILKQWAVDHPIGRSIAERESTLSRSFERGGSDVLSAREVAGSLNVTLDDLNLQIEVYSRQLLQQSRWQAELFAMDMAAAYEADH